MLITEMFEGGALTKSSILYTWVGGCYYRKHDSYVMAMWSDLDYSTVITCSDGICIYHME